MLLLGDQRPGAVTSWIFLVKVLEELVGVFLKCKNLRKQEKKRFFFFFNVLVASILTNVKQPLIQHTHIENIKSQSEK